MKNNYYNYSLLVIFLIFAVLLYGCSHQSKEQINQQTTQSTNDGVKEVVETPEPQPEIPPKTEPPTTEPKTKSPMTYEIDIKDFAYSPAELKIKKGDTVIWTNRDSAKHTVTSDSGTELDSKLLNKGETHSYTFNKAGTYAYHCRPHPYMKGRIIVD